jgi:hypothetical protein
MIMVERIELYRRRCVRKVIEVVEAVPGYWRVQSPIVLDETALGLLLLAGWLRSDRDFLFQCLEEMGVPVADLTRRIDDALNGRKIPSEDRPPEPPPSDSPPALRELTVCWLDRAAEEAHRLRQDYLGVEHLLLAFLRPQGAPLAVLLSECGLDRRRLTESVLNALRRGKPSNPEPAAGPSASGAIGITASATPQDALFAAVGMPKRFSIAIMMAWLTLFALVFSLMKCVEAPPQIFGIVTVLMLAIGLAQMWLFGGNNPRLASVLAGAVVLSVEVVALNLATGYFIDEPSHIVLHIISSIILIVICIPLGAFFGYLLGTLTAGIVLTLNYLENRKAAASSAETDSDAVAAEKQNPEGIP